MSQELLIPNAIPSLSRARKPLRLVLGVGDTPYAKAAEAHFSSSGWEVLVAKTAKDARKLAMKSKAAAVVLAADLGPETGWLSSAKLTRSLPNIRVVVVGKSRSAELDRFAAFAGAAGYVAESDGVCRLVKLLAGAEAVCTN